MRWHIQNFFRFLQSWSCRDGAYRANLHPQSVDFDTVAWIEIRDKHTNWSVSRSLVRGTWYADWPCCGLLGEVPLTFEYRYV